MRVIGLDVHRNFAQVAILESGVVKSHGRFAMARDAVLNFGATLTKQDDVVLEATGNTAIIVRLLAPFVHRVAIANPLQVRAIAWAKGTRRSSCPKSGCPPRRSSCSDAASPSACSSCRR